MKMPKKNLNFAICKLFDISAEKNTILVKLWIFLHQKPIYLKKKKKVSLA